MRNKLLFSFIFISTLHLGAQRHVFYLHGRIVETMGLKAYDSINGYGAYKYQDILDSLKSHGFIVHSEVRTANTDIKAYAKEISVEISDLISSGVDGSQITVIGASKGAVIAMYVSALTLKPEVNYVLLAGCSGSVNNDASLNLSGNVLSIYELSDSNGSCAGLRAHSPAIGKYKEVAINTGLRHGFLYRPIPAWLAPAVDWAKGKQ